MAMLAVTIPVASATLTEDVVALTIVPPVRQDIALVAPQSVTVAAPPVVAARPVRRAQAPPAAAAPAQPAPATFSGQVRDAQGGVMPGVLITMTDTVSGMSLSTPTDNNGRFIFKSLPPATYQFRASLPGFTTQTNAVTLRSGEEVQRNPVMTI